jgi:DNA-binding transcriptional LysR family regulator
MLELRQLRYFVAVAETEHMGMAAERLGISQSPLSRQIQQLEARLGLALFERSKQRIFLTTEGRGFLQEVRRLLAHAASVEQQAARIGKGETGRISIGYVEGALHAGVLRHSLREFQAMRPDVRISLARLRSQAQIDALLEGDIDVAHVYNLPQRKSRIASRLLATEPFVLAMPEQHPLAGARRAIRAEQLDAQPFVALPGALNPAARRQFIAACATAGFAPDIRYEAAEPSTVMALVGAGLGLALVQESLRQTAPQGVTFRQLGFFSERLQIFLVRRAAEKSSIVSSYEAVARKFILSKP